MTPAMALWPSASRRGSVEQTRPAGSRLVVRYSPKTDALLPGRATAGKKHHRDAVSVLLPRANIASIWQLRRRRGAAVPHMTPLVMSQLPLLATPDPASTRLQPASSLAAHRNGCTPVWVGPPQKAAGGRARSNAWCVERCSDPLFDCPADLCSCEELQRATRQRNSHRSANPIPRQCEQFIASDTTHVWAPCARIMERGLDFDFELAEKLGQIMQLAKQRSERPKLRALELGAGLGLYADQLARAGHKVVAVEPQPMHTATYDGAWPKQLEVNLFDEPGAACANALEPFDLVYSLGAVQDIPGTLHAQVADMLGNLTDGFLVFSAARVETGPAEYTEGSVRSGDLVPADAKRQWRVELQRRGLEYLPQTSLAFQPPGCGGNPGETGAMCSRLSGVMVFAAAGAPLGRAAEERALVRVRVRVRV